MAKTIFEILQETELPCTYSHFSGDDVPSEPPYIVYLGNGQDTFKADDTFYYTQNTYQIEYYFTTKDEEAETVIENLLLENGYRYTKSEDVYIEEEGVFVIYYTV